MPKPSAAATSRTKRYWLCQGCGTRNERRKIKCANPDCNRRRPKKPIRAHKRALRDNPYPVYEALNAELHGPAFNGEWHPSYCGVCGKPPTENRRSDRDHDHKTGLPRGLACGGNQGCNILMVPWVTAATAAGIALAKREAGESDAERWAMIYAYLERVETYRAKGLTEAP